jgi:hypothetical protein
LPDIIVCPATQSTSSKQLAIFLLLRWWNKADTWDDVSHVLQHGRVWCIKIYWAVFQLLAFTIIEWCELLIIDISSHCLRNGVMK